MENVWKGQDARRAQLERMSCVLRKSPKVPEGFARRRAPMCTSCTYANSTETLVSKTGDINSFFSESDDSLNCVAQKQTWPRNMLYVIKDGEKLKKELMKKIRKEAAARGGCIVLVLSQQSQSGGFFQDGHASMTGEIYTY